MNKADLVRKVSKVLSNQKEAQVAIDCILQTITEALAKKDAVKLVGFGTFKTAERKGKKGRNPQTGEEMMIPARTIATFVPGKALKNAIK